MSKEHAEDLSDTDTRAAREPGRLLALDLGARRVGVAISDERRVSVRALPAIRRASWKKLVGEVARLCSQFDATGVVVGLPLNMDGTEGAAAAEARRLARNFSLTLGLPVHLQDERLTSRAATEKLRAERESDSEIAASVDGESAAIILQDFLLGHARENEPQEPV